MIKFELQEVARHKAAQATIQVEAARRMDLRFAAEQPSGIVVDGPKSAHTEEEVSEATVIVEALDTAAYGKLVASSQKLDLRAIYKPTNTYALVIPRDDDNNRSPISGNVKWEFSGPSDTGADKDVVAGQDRTATVLQYRRVPRVGHS